LEDVLRLTTAAETTDRLHQRLGPGQVVVGGAGGDPVELVVAVVAAEGGVATRHIGVRLGAHVPAATPGFVADAPARHLPRLVAAVRPAQPDHGAVAVAGQVLDPLAHLLDGAAADVAVPVRICADQSAPRHKFAGAHR